MHPCRPRKGAICPNSFSDSSPGWSRSRSTAASTVNDKHESRGLSGEQARVDATLAMPSATRKMPSTSGEYNASNQVPFGSAATDQTAPAGAAATHRQTGKTAIAVLVVAVIVLAPFITSTVSRQMQAAEDRAEQESTQSVEATKSSEQAKSTAQAESTAQSDLNADLSLDGIQGSYWSNARKSSSLEVHR